MRRILSIVNSLLCTFDLNIIMDQSRLIAMSTTQAHHSSPRHFIYVNFTVDDQSLPPQTLNMEYKFDGS